MEWAQWRATKEVRALEHMTFEKGGENWACLSWQRGGQGDLTAACNYMKGSS